MKKRILLLILSFYLAVSTVLVPILYNNEPHFCRYFTYLSNFLMGFCALLLFLFLLIKKGEKLPRWLSLLQLIGTNAVTLTLITVVFFLTFVEAAAGYDPIWLFKNEVFFYHLLNPVVAILCFVLLEKDVRHSMKDSLLAVLPSFAYSLVYLTEVVILKNWEDFYGFTFGGKMGMIAVVIPVMYGLSFGLARALTALHNRGIAE